MSIEVAVTGRPEGLFVEGLFVEEGLFGESGTSSGRSQCCSRGSPCRGDSGTGSSVTVLNGREGISGAFKDSDRLCVKRATRLSFHMACLAEGEKKRTRTTRVGWTGERMTTVSCTS